MRECRGQNNPMGDSLLKEKSKAFAKELGIEFSATLIMIDKAWRAVTIHSYFIKSGFPSPNLVDVDDTLTEFNLEPSLWGALPEPDLTFDDFLLVVTYIAVWGALSDAEIVALDHNNTESDEDESEELTPVTVRS
ncbi:hypothetical protein TNCV_764061 [Trichonephila clavipes]|nr:hypothetical protein TNCV_764061 [Trichonephila clavipes]